MREPIDIVGERFGFLTVLHRDGGSSPVRWICRCRCGKELSVLGSALRGGTKKSCGSFRCSCELYDEDILGQRFGSLVVTGYPWNKMWECTCDCGHVERYHQRSLEKGLYTRCFHCECEERLGFRKTFRYGARAIYEELIGEIPDGYCVTSLDGTAFECDGNRDPENLILVDEKLRRKLITRKLNIKNSPEMKKAAILSIALELTADEIESGESPKQHYIADF